MTTRDQRRFVSELLRSIQADIMHAIDTELIPRSWDGIELREYLAEKTQRSRATHVLVGQRARDYDNHITITAGL